MRRIRIFSKKDSLAHRSLPFCSSTFEILLVLVNKLKYCNRIVVLRLPPFSTHPITFFNMVPPPPPVNRIVTKHDPDGAAVFAPAFEVPPRLYPHKSLNGSPVPDDSDTLLYTLIWNSEFKADNCAEEDGAKARCGLSRKDGVTFRFAPAHLPHDQTIVLAA